MKVIAGSCLVAALLVAGVTAQAPAPGPCTTVWETLQSLDLTQFIDAANLDSLEPALNDPTLGYTVFAPTNAAFEAAYKELDVQNATEVLYAGLLDVTMQNHFLLLPYTAAELLSLGEVMTNDNNTLTITKVGSTVEVDTAKVTKANIVACDSIVHVIDAVLVPNLDSSTA